MTYGNISPSIRIAGYWKSAWVQARLRKLEQKNILLEEKMKELKIVGKAKGILIEKKGMTEKEAHRYIGKMAMDNGVSRKHIAEDIIDEA